jgi:uncharacterized phage protein gp47/JayE
MTITSVAAQVTATGISAPSYDEILAYLQDKFRSIYGSDAYIGADSQDGQLLAIVAKGYDDCNQAAIAVYNSYSPSTAVGTGLSSVVKINHMTRLVASNSQVNVTIGGQAGTIILAGIVSDSAGNRWDLPASVTIPPGGTITVTATAQVAGAIAAAVGEVNQIITPVAGWQSVTNATAASPGNPVETDAELRKRQVLAPAMPSKTVLDGITSSIAALDGVTVVQPYENDTNATDANGLPPHSISMVVAGGDATEIATAIFNKKAPGVATYGTTTIPITDATGVPRSIHFFVPTNKPVGVAITLHALTGYTTAVAAEIKQAIADYINALEIGTDVLITRLYLPALLSGSSDSLTYELVTLQAAFTPAAVGTTDLVVAFNQKATCAVADISITVV